MGIGLINRVGKAIKRSADKEADRSGWGKKDKERAVSLPGYKGAIGGIIASGTKKRLAREGKEAANRETAVAALKARSEKAKFARRPL